jgi:hypothetical protein
MSTLPFKQNAGPMPVPYPLAAHDARDWNSAAVAFLAVLATVGGFSVVSNRFAHWFIIPISICGILMGTDAVDWFRGRLDLYDPQGLIGILGFHFFFLAPLLHVQWDFFMHEVSPPPDWRDWLGYMGVLNVIGIACYRLGRSAFERRTKPVEEMWEINKHRFRMFLPVCLFVSVAAQIWVYAKMGGISGYIDARLNDPNAFLGLGWVFMISESAPILAAFFLIVEMQRRKVSWVLAGTALFVLFVMQMLFGGLRGSRSETVQMLFWVVGCIHFLVRPFPRKLVYLGCVFLFAFMYLYGFYKDMGANATDAYSNSDSREQAEQKTGRTSQALVLGDFGRADVQSFILYRLLNDSSDFSYGYGRTYLGALAILIPQAVMPDRPDTKVKEGTDIELGAGAFVPGVLWSSRVYGLAGEAMLNFGPVSVPFAYALLGLLVGWFRSRVRGLLPGDARFLLVPFGVYLCVTGLSGDSDNLIFGLVKDGFLPLLVVLVCSVKWKLFVHDFAPSHR